VGLNNTETIIQLQGDLFLLVHEKLNQFFLERLDFSLLFFGQQDHSLVLGLPLGVVGTLVST